MLRDELILKMKESHAKIAGLAGDDLTREQAVFDELGAEVQRINTIEGQERALTHERESQDMELMGVFGKLMRGEKVDDVGREALCIRESSLADSAGDGAFRAPGDAVGWLAQPSNLERTTTTSTAGTPAGSVSSDISNLLKCPPLAPLFQLPLPPTPIFDKSTKLPAIDNVSIPFLVQTAADPFASVHVHRPLAEGTAKPEGSIPADGKEAIVTIEYAGSTIISDKALRRVPYYGAVIADFMRGALAFQVEEDIIAALVADAGVVQVPRQGAGAVNWLDLVNLEGGIPWWWAVQAEYAMAQTVQTYLKGTLASTPIGYPLYTSTTDKGMYTALNGRPFFLDAMPLLGVEGDVFYGDYRNVFLGIGQDIVFKRTSEGLTLTQANSTLFAVFAHIGIGIPVADVFARLEDVATTTTS